MAFAQESATNGQNTPEIVKTPAPSKAFVMTSFLLLAPNNTEWNVPDTKPIEQ